jgi:hypothetical protein
LRLTVHLGFQLIGLGLQGPEPVFHRLPAPPVFRQGNDAVKVGFGQALQLPFKSEPAAVQLLAPGLKILRQPSTAVRPDQGLFDAGGVREQPAQILPNQFVELMGRRKAGRAWLLARAA